jgi:hypothetical protein
MMSDLRETERSVQAYLAKLPTPTGADVDEKVLADALTTMHKTKSQSAAPGSGSTWRAIMMSRLAKVAAAVAVTAALFVTLFGKFSEPAWALEQSIDAMKDYRAIHLVGTLHGGAMEVWARANRAGTHSSDVVVRAGQGTILWTRNGSTYHYEPSQKAVYFEAALTVGITQWLGPDLLEMLRTAENVKVVHGKDPATGRRRVMLLCSMIDANGAQSWIIEFDVASKLPVTLKQWPNLDRSGPADVEATQIAYYEDLPDSVFDVRVPEDTPYVEKPLQIPDATVGILSNPQDGISAEGMTQQEAAEKAVRALYQAIIDQDLEQLKNICPLCRNWGDEFLRTIIFKPEKEDRVVGILEIGPISKTGRSPLGPIAALPVTVKQQSGKKAQQQMIVQFRQFGDTASCVVHGPYGLPREME